MRQDPIFYRIFKQFPSVFFELIGRSPAQFEGYRFESVEVKEPSFRIDGVFLPPEEAVSKVVYFAEVQFQKDQSLYHRFFSELFLYLHRNQNLHDDWYGVLIFPSRGLEPDHSTLHRSLLQGPQVQCLYLDELGSADEQSIGVRLIQLIVEPEERAIDQARQLIATVREEGAANLAGGAIMDIVTAIVVYKFVNLSREAIETMLGLNWEESRVIREFKEEGRKEGREEGREEGRLEARLEMVPMLLELGLTVEQVAERLGIDLEVVRRAATQDDR